MMYRSWRGRIEVDSWIVNSVKKLILPLYSVCDGLAELVVFFYRRALRCQNIPQQYLSSIFFIVCMCMCSILLLSVVSNPNY